MSFRDLLRRRVRSFGYAFAGLADLLRTQPHARFHLLATLLVAGAAVALGISAEGWAALALAMGLVWTAEALNTAVEYIVDLASPEWHPLAGKAKDVAAAAVLLAAFAAVAVAVAVLGPPLWALWAA